jgi:lipoprotein signal peptidase
VFGSRGQAHKPSSMSSHARRVVVDRPFTIRDTCCMIVYTHNVGVAYTRQGWHLAMSVVDVCVCVCICIVLYCTVCVCHDQYVSHGLIQSAEFVHHE